MASHHKPQPEDLPSREPVRPHAPPGFNPSDIAYRPRIKDGRASHNKPWVCIHKACTDQFRGSRSQVIAHWHRKHTPKPIISEELLVDGALQEDE